MQPSPSRRVLRRTIRAPLAQSSARLATHVQLPRRAAAPPRPPAQQPGSEDPGGSRAAANPSISRTRSASDVFSNRPRQGPSSRWSSPPGPAGPVSCGDRMNGLLAIHGRSGSGSSSQPDPTAEPLVATRNYTTSRDMIPMHPRFPGAWVREVQVLRRLDRAVDDQGLAAFAADRGRQGGDWGVVLRVTRAFSTIAASPVFQNALTPPHTPPQIKWRGAGRRRLPACRSITIPYDNSYAYTRFLESCVIVRPIGARVVPTYAPNAEKRVAL